MKRCTACGESKALDQFTRKSNSPDGLSFRCRDCQRAARQRLRANGSATRNAVWPERFTTVVDNRYFGVELEFVGSRSRTYMALVNAGLSGRVRDGLRRDSTEWELKTDGSVHGPGGIGLEVTSPKLRGAEGIRQLRIAVNAIASTGARANVSAGLHVHHDMSDTDLAGIKRIARFWLANQRHIQSLVARHRRNGETGSHYCASLHDGTLATIEAVQSLSGLVRVRRYHELNVSAYVSHGTVEVRLHEGTLEADEVVAWVQLTKAVVRSALGGETYVGRDLNEFTATLGFNEPERQWFAARAMRADQPVRRRRRTPAQRYAYA